MNPVITHPAGSAKMVCLSERRSRGLLVGLLLAVLLSGCGKPCPATINFVQNDIGLPAVLQLTDVSRSRISVGRVRLNGEEDVNAYVLGMFQKAGTLPVELGTGEVASFLVFPYSARKKIVRVTVTINGKEWEFAPGSP
ncbi:hypothetical protein BH09VER1_BH09VER1_47520 [soil metagenome]